MHKFFLTWCFLLCLLIQSFAEQHTTKSIAKIFADHTNQPGVFFINLDENHHGLIESYRALLDQWSSKINIVEIRSLSDWDTSSTILLKNFVEYPQILICDPAGLPLNHCALYNNGQVLTDSWLEMEVSRWNSVRHEFALLGASTSEQDKASQLDRVLSNYPVDVLCFYQQSRIQELMSLDPSNHFGFKQKYSQLLQERKPQLEYEKTTEDIINIILNREVKDNSSIILIDQFIQEKGLLGRNLQAAEMQKFRILAGMQKFDQALSTLDEAFKADSISPVAKNISKLKERILSAKHSSEEKEKHP